MRFNLLSSIRRPGARAALAAAVGVAALAAAGAAQAGGNVYWSVGVAAPGVQVGVANAPPVYAAAPVYVQPAPVYYGGGRNGAWGDRDRDGVPNIHDRYDNRRHHGHGRPGMNHGHGQGDADRDGVPNRYDRYPGNPYYR